MEFEHGKISPLERTEAVKTLEHGYIGHLGCFFKDDIYVVPVTYVFENPYVYSHSKDGKKIALMRKNPEVCLEVEEIQDLFEWKSVIAWGTFEELRGEEANRAMRLLIQKITSKIESPRYSPLEADFAALFEDAVIYRIHIKKITGRFEGDVAAPKP